MRLERMRELVVHSPQVDGTDDLWIDLRPGASIIYTSSTTAQAPTVQESPAVQETTASAVSFGFIAIAVLFSMFLVIAIFERILRPRQHIESLHHTHDIDVEFIEMSRRPLQWNSPAFNNKPPTSPYVKGVSVLMPGNEIPTFIAHPAPISTERPVPEHIHPT